MQNLHQLKKRIIDISYKYQKAHISSSLIAVETIDRIYRNKTPHEPFILSSGCAGLALFVVLEKYAHKNAETLFKKYGTYPQYNLKDGIYCSAGSLGHGIGIAVGMALSDKTRTVYCMVTDGECAEGSVWEAVRIAAELRLHNLNIFVIANGYAAYKTVDVDRLEKQIEAFVINDCPRIIFERRDCTLPHLEGIGGRYKFLSESEYRDVLVAL